MIISKNKDSICYRNGEVITEKEYDEIREIVHNKPVAPEGYGYKLTDALEWELYKLPVVEETGEELNETEEKAKAYDILMGVANE